MSKDKCMFTNDHEWLREEDGFVFIGLSDYAQNMLGDIVFVEQPKIGTEITAGKAFGSVESVKAVSDLSAPASGRVVAVNDELDGSPELLNSQPYDAWIIKLEPSALESDKAKLMNAADYEKYCESEA